MHKNNVCIKYSVYYLICDVTSPIIIYAWSCDRYGLWVYNM